MKWKKFRDYDCSVSDTGLVRYDKTGKETKGIPNRQGYLRVHLSKNGKKNDFRVHRMVAECFISNPNNLPEVDHINFDITCNNVSNLRWASRLTQAIHQRKKVYDETNNTGFIGVSCCIKEKKYVAAIRIDGVKHRKSFGYRHKRTKIEAFELAKAWRYAMELISPEHQKANNL